MIAALVVLSCALGALIGVLAQRWHSVRTARAAAERVHADGSHLPGPTLSSELSRLERAAAQREADLSVARSAMDRVKVSLDVLPVGIVIADDSGFELRNAAADHLLGIRHADVIVDEAVRVHLRGALAGELRRQTIDIYGPPRRSVEVTAFPVQQGGAARCAIAMVEDVTERVWLEAMRTDFVANISHELRTPVGALALLAETMEGERDPELVDRLADKMVLEAHRVTRTIQDLLELSQIEHGTVTAKDVLNVGGMASEAVDRMRHLADDRHVRIEVSELVRRLTMIGDRRQLVSALANLLDNAVKYSDAGSAIEVVARHEGGWIELSVTDHGIGIPSRDIDRIFERFYRVDRARSRDTGGTGLGLAIVRHVTTNHGGTVSVRSREGAGSTFTLRIPAGPLPGGVTLSEAG